jgi:rod shape-determining protein MreB and related proteins
MPKKTPFSFLSPEIAIDLGTANTLVYVKGRGLVINEPSVVAVFTGTNQVVAVGSEAKVMLGRTPEAITAVRPLRDGVIADYELAEIMIRTFIMQARRGSWLKPRVAVSVPSGITEVEKRAVKDGCERAGAREVILLQEPMAAAIGTKLPIHEPAGNMIVDIGGGTTEVAVISLAGIVTGISVRVGGDEIDEAIDLYLKKAYNLLVGEQTAEIIKKTIGNAFQTETETMMTVKGRDQVAGIPKTMRISSREIRDAIREPVGQIVAAVRTTLENTPPELSADIVDRGITLGGGGALLKGLDKLLNRETNLPVVVSPNALTCVVEGTGMVMEDIDFYRSVLIN